VRRDPGDRREAPRARGGADKDADLLQRARRKKIRIHELAGSFLGQLTAGSVVQGDEVMGLATPRLVSSRITLAPSGLPPRDPPKGLVQQRLQAARGVCRGEERARVAVGVRGCPGYHLFDAGGELRFSQFPVSTSPDAMSERGRGQRGVALGLQGLDVGRRMCGART